MTIESISQNELLELFEYRDGVLYWKINKPHSRYKAGDLAGRTVKDGYNQICVNGMRILTHQIVFKMFHGYAPKPIDHIDRNVDNNRIENLRPATNRQNQYNTKLSTRNKSGVKGVWWHKTGKKWQVKVSVNGRQTNFGLYDDLELAALVAQEARTKYHGAFANHG
jgi:hypothetical protein